MVPREYTNNAYAKSWGTTKSIMVFFRNGLFDNTDHAMVRPPFPKFCVWSLIDDKNKSI